LLELIFTYIKALLFGESFMKTILYTKWRKSKGSPLSYWNFHFDQELKELIQDHSGANWQPKIESFGRFPYSDEVIFQLISLVNRKRWLDYSGVKKVSPITTQEKSNATKMFAGIAQRKSKKFTDWMRN